MDNALDRERLELLERGQLVVVCSIRGLNTADASREELIDYILR